MTAIFNYLTLKTSGRSLLTRGASSYLSLLAVVMILVAIAEAIAWGYLGSTFTPNNPYLGATCLATFVFILIYFLDRSLLTYDTLEEYHVKTFSYFKPDKSNKLSKINIDISKLFDKHYKPDGPRNNTTLISNIEIGKLFDKWEKLYPGFGWVEFTMLDYEKAKDDFSKITIDLLRKRNNKFLSEIILKLLTS